MASRIRSYSYNTNIMFDRRFAVRAGAGLAASLLLLAAAFAQTGKRPLNHKDYDGWRSITGQKLSNDGKFLAYGLFPQEGDGEVVVRNLVTGQETRHPAGARPQPALAGASEEGPAPEARGATITFSADSKTLVFSTFPTKADTEKAKKDKKTGDAAPKDGMVIVNLASGQTARVERIKRFQMPDKAAGWLAYLKEAPESAAAPATATPAEKNQDLRDQQGGRGGRGGAAGGAAAGRGARPQFGTDLVLRSLADATERTFTDVTEFSFSDDGKQLLFAVSARDTARNGAFAARPGSADAPAALLAGKGKYQKFTWDENQTQLAFISDRDDADAKTPKWKIYRWDRQGAAAEELVSQSSPGFRNGLVLSDRGTLSFSKDGKRLYFAAAPPAPPAPAADADTSTDDKASVDLWSYKDDYISPIQKVRAERDRNRTYTAAWLIPEKKVVQLADAEMETVTTSESPQWVLGTDDREYRRVADYDERYTDAYVIDE